MNVKVFWKVEDPHLPEIISLPVPLHDTLDNFAFWSEWQDCVMDWLEDIYGAEVTRIEKV